MKPMKLPKAKEPTESEKQREKLHKLMTCSICGMPKEASRLYGIRCRNPEHAQMESEQVIDGWLKQQARKLGSGGKNRRMK